MTKEIGNKPIRGIANEAYERIQHGEARAVNMKAGQALAEAVRTTLGPRGMDKMLVDSLGGVVITNDGATIIQELDFANPAAKMVAEVAKTQDSDVGDGTTTGIVLVGALLGQAQNLFERGVHPKTIIDGYRQALVRTRRYYKNNSFDANINDIETLAKISQTAMTNKTGDQSTDKIVDLLVRAIQTIEEEGEVDLDFLQVETVIGGLSSDTELINGTIMEQTPCHPSMPQTVTNADIAVIDTDFEATSLEMDSNVTIANESGIIEFTDEESRQAKAIADRFAELGTDVIFVAENVDSLIAEYLAQNNILAAELTPDEGIKRVAKATGADIVSKLDAFRQENLGTAGRVEVIDIDLESHFFVEECPGNMVTLFVRGGTLHVQEEFKRNLKDAVSALTVTIEDGRLCPGGGTLEAGAADEIREFASSVGNREQLAIKAFAEALEIIPRTLAETAGMDPIDSIIELRRRFATGDEVVGVDVHSKSVANLVDLGVIEPLDVKIRTLETAVEASTMIFRIDDILESEELPDEREEMMNDMPR